jgi:hypothetical protein
MPGQKPIKINRLLQHWPKGTVATQTWLKQFEISRKLANWYVGSGWLVRFGPRAYVRPGDEAGWRGGLYALQTQLELSVHIGGLTALGFHGRAHFVPMGPGRKVTLISDRPEQLPAWFRRQRWHSDLAHHCTSMFHSIPDSAISRLDCGGYEVVMSSVERAIMELIHLCRNNNDILHAHELMRGLSTLRPDAAQTLLENCRSVKVKRFFLWSAESSSHSWFEYLDQSKISLGNGTRQIFKQGKLDKKYMITVPVQEELPSV